MPSTKPALPQEAPSKLKQLVDLASDEVKSEYASLVAKASEFDKLMSSIQRANALISGEQPPAPAPVQNGGHPHHRRIGRPPGQKNRKKWDDLSERDQILWQVGAAEAAAQANGDWQKKRKDYIIQTFGYWDKKLSKSLRAALAQTRGQHRPKLMKRILSVFGDEAPALTERLGKIPS